MKYLKKFEKLYDIDDLITYIDKDNINKVKEILSTGIDVNSRVSRTYTAIHSAAYSNLDIFDLLLEYGADIDAKNEHNGNTILIDVSNLSNLSNFDNIKTVYHIIDRGADWNIKNNNGKDFIDSININHYIYPNKGKQKIVDDIIKKYPKKYQDYLTKKDANKYGL